MPMNSDAVYFHKQNFQTHIIRATTALFGTVCHSAGYIRWRIGQEIRDLTYVGGKLLLPPSFVHSTADLCI